MAKIWLGYLGFSVNFSWDDVELSHRLRFFTFGCHESVQPFDEENKLAQEPAPSSLTQAEM